MKISSLFNKGKTVFSFEVFPPKKDSSAETIYETLNALAGLKPEFISVTYSAGGTGAAAQSTIGLCDYIKNRLGIETCAHLTCVNSKTSEIESTLASLKAHGIENILALRGDIQDAGVPAGNPFSYASDLITYIKAHDYGFGIMGACCPEGHPESQDIIRDVLNLKKKVDAGAEVLVSQMFFDNSRFYEFMERCRLADINVPVTAGIMPVTNKKQFERMISLSGAGLPSKFTRMVARFENNPEALADAGAAYAVDQIVDLISNGAAGIHLYTMNKPVLARKITEAVKSLL